VLVKRTFDPSATPVVQPEKLPEKAKFETAFGAPPLERLAKALATSAAETEPDACTVTPANVKDCPAVMLENVASALSVTAALLLINTAETPMFASLIALTTPLGVGLVTETEVSTPGDGP
jgi:hypothetical protein